ncbi:MAG: hypothetical protein K0S27_1603 [Gammaproteobacteria bacterium]|nr:hypothetical protein [Gammaproteobacteria bacterium]
MLRGEEKKNDTEVSRLPGLFDSSQFVSSDIWLVTQVAAGPSTRFWGRGCPSCCEPGHASLIIEKNEQDNYGIYVFDYSVEPPAGAGVERKKGYVWLHHKYEEDRDKFQTSTQFQTYFKDLPARKKHTWSCSKGSVEKLLQHFILEFRKQYSCLARFKNESIPLIPIKTYSLFFENCYFLMAEKLTQNKDLRIEVATPEYINKFHLGGWKYTMLFGMPTGAIFSSMIPSMYSVFELLALNRKLPFSIYDPDFYRRGILVVFPESDILKYSFFDVGPLVEPTVLIYISSNLVSLIITLLSYFKHCPVSDANSVKWRSVLYGLFANLIFSASSLGMQAFLSPIENADESVLLWLGEELCVPIMSLSLLALIHYACPHLCCRNMIKEEESEIIKELMSLSPEERSARVNKHFLVYLFSLLGMLANAVIRALLLEGQYKEKKNEMERYFIFLCLYPLTCLVAGFLSAGWSKQCDPLKYALKPALIYLGLMLPTFILINNKIERLHSLQDLKLYYTDEKEVPAIFKDWSIPHYNCTLQDKVPLFQDFCGEMSSYLTSYESGELLGWALLFYTFARLVHVLLMKPDFLCSFFQSPSQASSEPLPEVPVRREIEERGEEDEKSRLLQEPIMRERERLSYPAYHTDKEGRPFPLGLNRQEIDSSQEEFPLSSLASLQLSPKKNRRLSLFQEQDPQMPSRAPSPEKRNEFCLR